MTRYLHTIVLIGCIQTILITGYALATDHKIAEIIRGKVEKIRSAETLQIDDAQIASITVLPELYERDAGVLKGLNGKFKFRKRPVGQERQTL